MIQVVYAEHSYKNETPGRLQLNVGDMVQVIQQHESGWYEGIREGQRGWFPSNFCSKPSDMELNADDEQQMAYFGWVKQQDSSWLNELTQETMKAALNISVSGQRRGSGVSSEGSVRTHLSVHASWRDVRKMVTQQITSLIESASDDQVDAIDGIVGTIHNMLIASNTFSRQSPILQSSKVLKTHHKHIVKSLASLSKLKPIPGQLTAEVHHSLSELMVAVKHFSELAEQMQVPLHLDQQVKHVKSFDRISLSPYTPTLSITSESLTLQQEIQLQLEPSYQEIMETLQQMKDSVKSTQFKPVDIIDLTKSSVTKIGQLLSLLDELDASAFDNQAQLELRVSIEHNREAREAFDAFMERKEEMYQSIFGLVNTTTECSESFAPSDAARRILRSVNLVHKNLSSIFSMVRPRLKVWVQQELESQRLSGVKSDEPDQILNRRTQSMNFLKVSKKPSIQISTITQGVAASPETTPRPKSSILHRLSMHSPLSMSLPSGSFFDKMSPTARKAVVTPVDENKMSGQVGESVSLQGQRHSQQLLNGHAFLGSDVGDKDVHYGKAGDLKGATLKALVCIVTDHRQVDVQFLQYFLLTYRTMTKFADVLQVLIDRFNMECPSELNDIEAQIWYTQKQKPIRLRVYNLLKTWLEGYIYTDHDMEALPLLEKFCHDTLKHILPSATEKLLKVIDKRRRQRMDDMKLRRKTFINPVVAETEIIAPSPVLPRRWNALMTVVDFDPLEIARQLTLHDFQLYYNIQPIEFLQNAWSDKKNDYSPNIKKLIQESNKVTAWVADTILSEEDVKERAQIIKQFILIADKCRQLNNFNTLMSILAALASSPIHRLKRSFDLLSNRTQSVLNEIKELMSPTANFANYRMQLKSVQPPCFPFLGRYLTDLTFIEDGNPNFLKQHPNLINVDKRVKAAEKIVEIQQYQQSHYKLQLVPDILHWLELNLNNSETDNDVLYDRSLLLEPRERDDETMARMLSETGLI